MNWSELVRQLHREHPSLGVNEPSRRAGCSAALVSRVIKRQDLAVNLCAKNLNFVRHEAQKLGVSIEEVINAIVTDARVEAKG